jgi:transcription elongation factor Elf1
MSILFWFQIMDWSFEVVPVGESIEKVVATFSCNKCSFTTKYKTSLKRHQYRHVKNTLCGVNINQILVSHICDQCRKSFRSRYGMQVHAKIKHQQKFRFTCAVCNKGFHHLWNFRGHLSSHQVSCETCGKAFNYESSLTMHKKHCKSNGSDGNNNSIDSEFVCDLCNIYELNTNLNFWRHNLLYAYVKFELKNYFEFNLLLFKNCKIISKLL